VVANLEPEAHLLHIKHFSVSLVNLLLLRFLVVIFAPVDNLDYWWVGIWRYLNQIQLLVFGQLQGFRAAHDAELFAVAVDYPKLWCPNGTIQASASADIGSPLCIFTVGIVPKEATGVNQVSCSI
jgi:hypothetical protein